MEAGSFEEIQEEFLSRVRKMVWCNVATIDSQGRPRSRILHPIWDGPVGWIATRKGSYKTRNLASNPYVSLAYVSDVARPVYVDCKAEWVEDPAEKSRIWDLYLETEPPLGYDPAPIFKAKDDAGWGLLKLTPWRLELYVFPPGPTVWRPDHKAAE
jgi:general stress protein 26